MNIYIERVGGMDRERCGEWNEHRESEMKWRE